MPKQNKLPPVHPGEILRTELLVPLNISPIELAQAIQVPKEIIRGVCEERADITPDLAARLALYFNSTPQFWMNMQKSYDEKVLANKLEALKKQIKPYKKHEQNRAKEV